MVYNKEVHNENEYPAFRKRITMLNNGFYFELLCLTWTVPPVN